MGTQDAPRVLVVEDDQRLLSMVEDYLRRHKFDVRVESSGDAAIAHIRDDPPDAVVLDINLPGEDGFGVCRAVRDSYGGAILMLTARSEEIDEVLGLELGADDYLRKPISPRVLVARLHALLRRGPRAARVERLTFGDLTIDLGARAVSVAGRVVDLTTAEFDLLWLLARQAGKPLSREAIYGALRGIDFDGLDRSIDLRVSRLRKKLGDDPKKPRFVKSVRGVGYLFLRSR